jgi:hypothetical protein
MIAVAPGAVTITYTDTHRVRARFFPGLLWNFPVQRSGQTTLRDTMLKSHMDLHVGTT